MSFVALLQHADEQVHDRLGDSCVYSPSVGASATVRCVYDAAYVLAEPRAPGVSSSGPAVFVRAESLPAGWEADVSATVERAGVTYAIREVQPDGQGGVLLLLHVTS